MFIGIMRRLNFDLPIIASGLKQARPQEHVAFATGFTLHEAGEWAETQPKGPKRIRGTSLGTPANL